MNWFTTSHVEAVSLDKKKALVAEWGGCEHVKADVSLVAAVQYENDSFGREGYCVCKECLKISEDLEDNEKHTCRDCSSKFSLAEGGTLWRWYDFYPAQGDEPIPVCKDCRQKEKHLARVRKDNEDLEWEQERYS